MSKSWAGENDIKNSLNDLIGDCSVSKIKQFCSICFKYQAEYKMVVFEIEKFIKKSKQDDRIAGLFGLDALCKASRSQFGKEKDIFSNRFSLRLKETLTYIDYNKLNDKEKSIVSRMFDEWRKKDMFSDVVIPVVVNPLPDKDSSKSKEKSSKHSSSNPPPIQQQQQQQQQPPPQPPTQQQPNVYMQPPIIPKPPSFQPPIQPPMQSHNSYYPNTTSFNNYPDNTNYNQQAPHQSNYSFQQLPPQPPSQFPQGGMQHYDTFHNNIGSNFNSFNDNDATRMYNKTGINNVNNYGIDNFNQYDVYNNPNAQYDTNQNQLKFQEPSSLSSLPLPLPETLTIDNKVIDIKQEKRKTAKVCPFRSGDCLFKDKCRFSHYEWSVGLSSLLDVKKDNNSLVANMNNSYNLRNKRKQDIDYQFLFESFQYPNVFDDNDIKVTLSKPYQKKTNIKMKKQKQNDRIIGSRVVYSSNNGNVMTSIVRKDVFDNFISN